MNIPWDQKRFDEWKVKVNAIVIRKTGVSCDDLPDYCYADCFQMGNSPSQTAMDVIRNAKEY